MSPTNENELIGKKNHLHDLKKVKRRSISLDKVTYRLHVFLFSSEKLENDKHLKLAVSHLSPDFTYTLNRYCLFMQRQYTNTITLFHVYITMYLFV